MFFFQDLSIKSTVEDITGKQMDALPVFSFAIRYLWNHFLKEMKERAQIVLPKEIRYVITVPAIWEDRAKQFMREAAIMVSKPLIKH